MFVYEKMTKNIESVMPDFPLSKAFQILKEKNHLNLPVVDKNKKLVGIISEKILFQVNPKKSISLSDYEINFLLNQTKISDIMETGVLKINENKHIEEAALIMKENKIDFLPVVDSENILVGIITMFDILKAFINILNIKYEGTTICIESKAKNNDILNIVKIISDENIEINYISTFNDDFNQNILLKLNSSNIDNILKKIEALNYIIKYVYKNN